MAICVYTEGEGGHSEPQSLMVVLYLSSLLCSVLAAFRTGSRDFLVLFATHSASRSCQRPSWQQLHQPCVAGPFYVSLVSQLGWSAAAGMSSLDGCFPGALPERGMSVSRAPLLLS